MKVWEVNFEVTDTLKEKGIEGRELAVTTDKEGAILLVKQDHPDATIVNCNELKVDDYFLAPIPELEDKTDELAYIDFFDDLIFAVLQKVSEQKGYNLNHETLNNEMIMEIRNNIIDTVNTLTANTVDLSKTCVYQNFTKGTLFTLKDRPNNTYQIIKHGKNFNVLDVDNSSLVYFNETFNDVPSMMQYFVELNVNVEEIGHKQKNMA